MKSLSSALVSALLASSMAATAVAADAVDPLSENASIARGGRLYEYWAHEAGERDEIIPNPAFKTKDVRVEAKDTWRCVECHGWDYKGNHDFVGIRGSQGRKSAEIIAILKGPLHRFEGMMHEAYLTDLANFVSRGQVDMAALIAATRNSKTDTKAYENIFATTCANCHGLDGGRQRGVPQLGVTARKQSSKVLHVILNGHAGGNMPALRAFGTSMAVGMLAYVQSLPSQNMAASIANGGRLYDDWQGVTGNRQALSHPAYPRKARYADVPRLTWRCIECHGPDYKGNEGQYATGPHATGIKGIRGMAGADPAQILTILTNRTHRYGAVLKYRDLEDLANFVSHGQVDMDAVVDRQTGLARGDAKRGEPYYQTICLGCHGARGSYTAKRVLGRRAKRDPWQALHSMLNGHPDDNMPALRELDQKVIADILAYIQSLPETRQN